MSASSLIVIIVTALALTAAILGYALGALRTQREKTQALQRQVEANSVRIGIQGATIHRIAEDYDPPEETPEERRRRFTLIEGGGAGTLLFPIFLLGAWLRQHWRPTATAAGAAATAAVLAVALSARGAPSGPPHIGVPPARPSATQSPSTSATPAPSPAARPRPGRTTRVPTVPVLMPTRTRRPTAPASGAPSGPPGPSPTPTRPGPTPSPTPSCSLVYVVALGVIKACL